MKTVFISLAPMLSLFLTPCAFAQDVSNDVVNPNSVKGLQDTTEEVIFERTLQLRMSDEIIMVTCGVVSEDKQKSTFQVWSYYRNKEGLKLFLKDQQGEKIKCLPSREIMSELFIK